MIFGIGTDIVTISRMEEALARHGERFTQRILAESEMSAYKKSPKPAHFLAKRFAAKEATAKAFGTGFRNGLSMTHITIENDELGKPYLCFSGYAEQFCSEHGIGESFLSLSDEKEHAIAFVTLLRN